MNKIFASLIVLLSGFCFPVTSSASVVPCSASDLVTYAALDPAGCSIGSAVFSHFAMLNGPTGSLPFSTITVTPMNVSATVVGIDFGFDPSTSNGHFYDNVIQYQVSSPVFAVSGVGLALTGFDVSGSASVTGITDLCLGGAAVIGGCNGQPSLVVTDAFPTDALIFLPIPTVGVATDIGFDSGPEGTDSSSLRTASNRFTLAAAPSVVPEPAPVLLLAGGLIAWIAARRRRTSSIRLS